MSRLFVFIKKLCLSLLLVASPALYASPWVEADDAYLRADLQLLADAGLISTPLQTFPLPWHTVARDLKKASLDNLPNNVLNAYRHVQYALETAQLERGNKQVKLTAANFESPSSYGQYNGQEWQVEGAYSTTHKRTAARLNINYGQPHGEDADINFDGSFAAYTTGNVDITVGSLHKWWGASWQSNLAQPFASRPAPLAYIAYAGNDLSELDAVYLEGGVSYVNDLSPYQQKWAGRINVTVAKPLSLGASYIRYQGKTDKKSQQWLWYDVLGLTAENNNQFIVEGRLSLPTFNGWNGGVYSQQLISDGVGQQGANITGIDLQNQVMGAQLRLVLENRYNPLADNNQLNSHLNGLKKIESGQFYQLHSLSNQLSVGGYVQLSNNQQFNLFYHFESYHKQHNRLSGEYQLPLLSSLFSIRLSMSDADWQKDNLQLATSWDYRF
ncbi:capsule assembly Wzi family protein [Motilimonas sp. E26]|uniref:capsule assembly Wzi family protein n=1 Tax=Motilimonas sp. E26 TaxID=2865674 RepID=UPI001E32DAF9|nr:capsule assembly Wzi family protein [Motilimonas sp. E26]MCE0558555.1 capsule assembly Wzi family protein [Motilimonas sp. E26]